MSNLCTIQNCYLKDRTSRLQSYFLSLNLTSLGNTFLFSFFRLILSKYMIDLFRKCLIDLNPLVRVTKTFFFLTHVYDCRVYIQHWRTMENWKILIDCYTTIIIKYVMFVFVTIIQSKFFITAVLELHKLPCNCLQMFSRTHN